VLREKKEPAVLTEGGIEALSIASQTTAKEEVVCFTRCIGFCSDSQRKNPLWRKKYLAVPLAEDSGWNPLSRNPL
jgi:hypothetical protein